MVGGGHGRKSALQGDQGSPGLASRPSLTCCSQSVEPMRPVASAGYSALAGLRLPFPHTLPPQGGGGALSPVLLLLSLGPSDVDQVWDLRPGELASAEPTEPREEAECMCFCCRELGWHIICFFSVCKEPPLQGGGAGCWLHHAHRGVLQEQGRVLGSGEGAAQLTRGEGPGSACVAGGC